MIGILSFEFKRLNWHACFQTLEESELSTPISVAVFSLWNCVRFGEKRTHKRAVSLIRNHRELPSPKIYALLENALLISADFQKKQV